MAAAQGGTDVMAHQRQNFSYNITFFAFLGRYLYFTIPERCPNERHSFHILFVIKCQKLFTYEVVLPMSF